MKSFSFVGALLVAALSTISSVHAEYVKSTEAVSATSANAMVMIDAGKDVAVPVYWMPNPAATATVILLPGGAGEIGNYEGTGHPTSNNFLVRSRQMFEDQGFNVVVMGAPTDMEGGLDWGDRVSSKHMDHIAKVIAFIKSKSDKPVWIVGTSRGTVSAAAAAIALGSQISGIVLTSSVTHSKKSGTSVTGQNLSKVTVPVLVMHHVNDACKVCVASEVPGMLKDFSGSAIKKMIIVSGGGNPTGDPCGNQHYHGFIGLEQEAVNTIGAWIKNPTI